MFRLNLFGFDSLFGNIFGREVSEGALRIFRSILILPWFIRLIIGPGDKVFELVLAFIKIDLH